MADEIEIKEEFDIREIYTPLSEAKEEVLRRWNDKDLRKKVEEYLGCGVPDPFIDGPRAVLSRSIITPNFECLYFLGLVKDADLKPIGLEGVEDKFCTKNSDKVSLGKLTFYDDIENNNIKSGKKAVKVIDMEKSDGERFCDIKTLWGENFVDFHHRMLADRGCEIELFDDFKWFTCRDKRNTPYQYYENLFALFICHGILFENFHAKGKEKDFTDNVIIKNYKHIMEVFGLKPLIVPLVPIEDEMHLDYWNGYVNRRILAERTK
jgi:hypothetical protein